MMRSHGPRRSGLASMWGLVVLTVAGTMLGCLTTQLLSNRRELDRRQNRLQAQWLARGGLELAAERLLMDAASYKGETTAPLTNSSVKISVAPVPGEADQYQITSVARYPVDGRDVVAISSSAACVARWKEERSSSLRSLRASQPASLQARCHEQRPPQSS